MFRWGYVPLIARGSGGAVDGFATVGAAVRGGTAPS
jgi:hypothetical protein